MKKISLILLLLLFLKQNSLYAQDYYSYCSVNSAKKTFGGNFASVSGFNSLTRNIIESQIQKAIKKETGSKTEIKIDSFYGVNILNGEFKSLKAKAKDFNSNGLHFSNLFVETICPYNSVEFDDNSIKFRENMVLKYQTELTQDNLNDFISSSKYQKIINSMNENKALSSILKIENSKVEIKDDKLQFVYQIIPNGANSVFSIFKNHIKTFKINFSANLKVENGKIVICDFKLNKLSSKYSYLLPLVNYFNPMNYQIDVDKNNKAKLNVENVKIANSKINIDGFLVLEKN